MHIRLQLIILVVLTVGYCHSVCGQDTLRSDYYVPGRVNSYQTELPNRQQAQLHNESVFLLKQANQANSTRITANALLGISSAIGGWQLVNLFSRRGTVDPALCVSAAAGIIIAELLRGRARRQFQQSEESAKRPHRFTTYPLASVESPLVSQFLSIGLCF